MKFKRLMSAILSTALISTLCTACTNSNAQTSQSPSTTLSSESSEPVEIEFLNIFTSGEHALDELVAEFNAMQDDIVVTPVYVAGSSYSKLLEEYQMLASTQKQPAVSMVGLTYTDYVVQNMPLVPVQEFIDEENFDTSDYYETMLALGQNDDGVQYLMPYVVSAPMLFYNKEIFTQANLDPDAPPQTFEDVRKAASAITQNGKQGIYFTGIIDTDTWVYQGMVESMGGQMLSTDKTTATFNQEAGVAAAQYISDLINVDKSMILTDYVSAAKSFGTGETGMLVGSSAMYASLAANPNIGITTFPTDGENALKVPAGGNCLAISNTTPEKNIAAWEFVQFLTNPESISKICRATGYMSISKSAVQTPELLGDYLAEDERASVVYNQVDGLTEWQNYPGNLGTKIPTIIQDNLQAILAGTTSPQEGLDTAAQAVNSYLG